MQDLRIALISTLILTVILCGLYPLVIWGIAQAVFSDKANGSLIVRDGTVIGSSLIGQNFTGPQYFHARPSAAGSGYDGASSSGTNLGPTSQKLLDAVKERVAAYRKENGLADDALVPADAVTASSSGLDPHISERNAALQTSRVATARKLSEEEVRRLVEAHTEGPDLGILGDPGVNVLMLNLALDDLSRK
ncbi:MAG: K(+)-transporting ATPase subunit C [Candidatus Latescibacteria bacterium]|nr:K(+)-transporting ATPase subunit C [Candidatus Latescibacterota bacterium]